MNNHRQLIIFMALMLQFCNFKGCKISKKPEYTARKLAITSQWLLCTGNRKADFAPCHKTKTMDPRLYITSQGMRPRKFIPPVKKIVYKQRWIDDDDDDPDSDEESIELQVKKPKMPSTDFSFWENMKTFVYEAPVETLIDFVGGIVTVGEEAFNLLRHYRVCITTQ